MLTPATTPVRRSDPGGVVSGLCRAFQRQGLDPQVIETHISWVLLAGDLAYKIKKPVCLGFLDFTTLGARRRFCDEELRLNARLAARLYQGVVAIHATADGPALDADGPVIEYAVKMHRLAPRSLASELLADGSLDGPHLGRFAEHLEAFHRDAPAAGPGVGHGTPQVVAGAAMQVLDALESLAGPLACMSLARWIGQQSQKLAVTWRQRLADGRVREGHGDLHLDNVVMLDGELTAFDCIEFDPALRWIDVMSDVAFLAMDLLAHGRRDLAFGFLDDYLARSGDYEGIAVLRFYLVYRALVRAMVAALREQGGVAAAGLPSMAYLRCAQQLAAAGDARLLITHGLPGSGKSHVSRQLLECAGAIRIRSDVERRRLTSAGERYGPAATAQTYGRLGESAQWVLHAGFPTIVDAAFLRRDERARMERLAGELQVPFTLLDCQAPLNVLRERVRRRTEQGDDASQADVAVLERLAPQQEDLDDHERALAIEVRTDAIEGIDVLAGRWLAARCPVV
jgi:uncharacterized protein